MNISLVVDGIRGLDRSSEEVCMLRTKTAALTLTRCVLGTHTGKISGKETMLAWC